MEFSDTEDTTPETTRGEGRKTMARQRGENTSSGSSSTLTSGARQKNKTKKENERQRDSAGKTVVCDKRNVEETSDLDKNKDSNAENGKESCKASFWEYARFPWLLNIISLLVSIIAILIALYALTSIPNNKPEITGRIDVQNLKNQIHNEIEQWLTKKFGNSIEIGHELQVMKEDIEKMANIYESGKLVEREHLDRKMKEGEENLSRDIKRKTDEIQRIAEIELKRVKDKSNEISVSITTIQSEQTKLHSSMKYLGETFSKNSEDVKTEKAKLAEQISLVNTTQGGLIVYVEKLNETVKNLTENITGILIETLVSDQKIKDIKENVFDKGSMIAVIMLNTTLLVLVIIYLVANRDTNRHVEWNVDIAQQHTNGGINSNPPPFSTAGRIMRQVQSCPQLERKLCVISFYEETHPLHMRMTQSVTHHLNLEYVEFIIRRHEEILTIPPVSLYFLFVDFNERNVILEDPTLGLGDLRLTTVQATQKMAGKIVIFYVRDENSKQLGSTKLYNEDLASVTRQLELSALNQQSRFISAYNSLTAFQIEHLQQIVVHELNGH